MLVVQFMSEYLIQSSNSVNVHRISLGLRQWKFVSLLFINNIIISIYES